MELLTTPENMIRMRGEPVHPVRKVRFTHWSSPRELIDCRFYFTQNHTGNDGVAVELEPESITPERLPQQPPRKRSYNPTSHTSSLSSPRLHLHTRSNFNLDSPGFEDFALGFARHHNVLMFEDRSESLDHRAANFRSLLNHFTATALGGRSRGARAAVRGAMYTSCKTLIFYTYPLVRDLETRFEKLLALDSKTEVLFVLGDSNPQCPEMQLALVRKRMEAKMWWVRVLRADHRFEFKEDLKKRIPDVCGQIAGLWLKSRDFGLTELTVQTKDGVVVWTEWMALRVELEGSVTSINLEILSPNLSGGNRSITVRL
ncbi:hypothetical protein DL98DRAFT_591764 [Cadophora sp. DSE1049]|nr:hypothetical protein DL98DRAFT_591764 [Cadophora sp. DSE1049]